MILTHHSHVYDRKYSGRRAEQSGSVFAMNPSVQSSKRTGRAINGGYNLRENSTFAGITFLVVHQSRNTDPQRLANNPSQYGQ
jgi:hypothetical protein